MRGELLRELSEEVGPQRCELGLELGLWIILCDNWVGLWRILCELGPPLPQDIVRILGGLLTMHGRSNFLSQRDWKPEPSREIVVFREGLLKP